MEPTTPTGKDVVTARIRGFIREEFPLAGQRDIGDSDSLLENGIVDSMGILEIVGFIEREFEIELSDEDLLADTFESVETLSCFVAGRLETVTAGR